MKGEKMYMGVLEAERKKSKLYQDPRENFLADRPTTPSSECS